MRIVSVTNRVMIEVTVAFAAYSRTKAATMRTTARLRRARWSSSAGFAEPSWSGAVDRWEIMTAVVAMPRTAMAPTARRMARLPKAPCEGRDEEGDLQTPQQRG
jgi:hypothetical protein